jgi:hypothetical protein
MKTKTDVRFAALIPIFTVMSCFHFATEQKIKAQKEATVNKPDVHISVKKETDKNGNITSYDSTYISTWTGSNDSLSLNDSVYSKNEEHINKRHFGIMPFEIDSTFAFNHDFFNDDSLFFQDVYKSHKYEFYDNAMKEMEEMMRRQNDMFQQLIEKSFHIYDSPEYKIPDDSGSIKQNTTPKNENYQMKPEL